MNLATSNNITSGVVTSDANAAFDIADVLPFTFDSNYQSQGASALFVMEFATGDLATYVGIAGHNIGTLGATITISNHGTEDVTTFAPIDDRPLMFIIPERSGGTFDLRITITKGAGQQVIISHIASGFETDLTGTSKSGQSIGRDYQAGYPRIPMVVARKSKTTLNDAGAPVATITKTISSRVRLAVKNVPTSFASGSLLAFQKFWVVNGFFMQNDDDTNQSYMAFNFIPEPPRTHGSTRELVDLRYSFMAYNGQ